MSEFVTPFLIALAWFSCGAVTVLIDRKDYPETVVAGVDEAFRAFMLVCGPLMLLVVLIARADIKRMR